MDKLDLTYELQKIAAESPDEVEISIDENGEVEFELDLELFLAVLKKTWT